MEILKNLLRKIFPHWVLVQLKKMFLQIRYFGREYYCPLCNSHINTLKPIGFDFPVLKKMQIVGGGKRDALCPVCMSSDRVRLNYLFLVKYTEIFSKQTKLLHLAPEPSLKDVFIKDKNINYLTADLYKEDVMEKIDITNIQYPDRSFDAIIGNHILEHIPDDMKAMNELYRALKPGGWAILQVPFSKILDKTFEDSSVNTEAKREKVFGQKDHVRIYGLDYPERLRKAGFKVTEYKWTEDVDLKKSGNRMGLNEDEIVFYCIR